MALRTALGRSAASAELGALWTVVPAFAVVLVAALVRFDWDVAGLWAFALAGFLGPGLSQTLFTLGVREAGPARASVTVGTAPLFSVAIALVVLGEPVVAGVLAGAALIVAGGLLLIRERDRPLYVRRIGLAYALGATVVFATRDNLVRWLATGSDVSPELAAAVTVGSGVLVIATWVVLARRPFRSRPCGSSLLRAFSSDSRTCLSSRRSTAAPSRSSRRSWRRSRSGAWRSPCSF